MMKNDFLNLAHDYQEFKLEVTGIVKQFLNKNSEQKNQKLE